MTEPEILSALREIETLARASGSIAGPLMIASLAAETIERIENPAERR